MINIKAVVFSLDDIDAKRATNVIQKIQNVE